MKRYINLALLYAILSMVGGVFCREFTKFNSFTAKTASFVVHIHYFLLGMVFFLLLLVLEKNLSFTGAKTGSGRSHLWHGRDRAHSAECQPGASAAANQAERISFPVLSSTIKRGAGTADTVSTSHSFPGYPYPTISRISS